MPMITGHPTITRILRDGGTLTLHIAEERAELGPTTVDWKTARSYTKRLRHGNQPELSRHVVLNYPNRTVTLTEEKKKTRTTPAPHNN